MDESSRLFLSARLNMFNLLTKEAEGKRELLTKEQYQEFKASLRSFSEGQGSYGYAIPVAQLEKIGLNVSEWSALGKMLTEDKKTIHLTDYYHVCGLDNVLDHILNENSTAISALQDAVNRIHANQEKKRA